jgi:hypothetical protein
LGARAEAFAESKADIEPRIEDLRRGAGRGRLLAQAPSIGVEAQILGGPAVTQEQLQRAPEDPELVFAYAKAAARRGEFLDALIRLQNLVMQHPREARYRLVYAVVLRRLNAVEKAQEQLTQLAAPGTPPEIRRLAEAYRAQLTALPAEAAPPADAAARRTTAVLIVQTGFQYDHNKNAAPRARRIESAAGEIEAVKRRSDYGLGALVRVASEHELDRSLRLTGTVDVFHDQSFRSASFLGNAFQTEGGLVYETGPWEFRLLPRYRHISLASETAQVSWGGSVEVSYRATSTLALFAGFSGEQEVYNALDFSPSSGLRTGPRLQLTGGAQWEVAPGHLLMPSVALTRKEAREGFYAYRGIGLSLEHVWTLAEGMRLSTQLSWQHDGYDSPDPLVVPGHPRADDILRAKIAYTTALGALPGLTDLHHELASTRLGLSFDYSFTFSNIRNYSYQTFRGGVTLTKRFSLF